MFKKFALPFHPLKMSFEKSAKFRMTHFNLPVAINAARIIKYLESSKASTPFTKKIKKRTGDLGATQLSKFRLRDFNIRSFMFYEIEF